MSAIIEDFDFNPPDLDDTEYASYEDLCDLLHVTVHQRDTLLKACKAVIQMYDDSSIFRHPRNCPAIKAVVSAIALVEGNADDQ